jgi:hypothetical protein
VNGLVCRVLYRISVTEGGLPRPHYGHGLPELAITLHTSSTPICGESVQIS